MKNFYTKLFYILFLCVITPFFANAYQFTKDLKQGDINSDVLQLQKILNSDIGTSVSFFGSGSKFNETNYFGNLTKQAVVKFQEKYKNEILTPNGLIFGTGFVGPSTRRKLETFITVALNKPNLDTKPNVEVSNIVTGISNSGSSSNLTNIASGVISAESLFRPISEKDIFISSISPFAVKSGDIINIKAVGLLNENILHIGDYYSQNINSSNGDIKISVPNIGLGEYPVWIENKNGSSKEISVQYIKISNQPKASPIITKSYPQNVSADGVVTVEGVGFAQENNSIYSTLGVINGLSSKNGKITFTISDFPEIKRSVGTDFGGGGMITYRIKNSDNLSSNYAFFSLTTSFATKDKNIFKSFLSLMNKTVDFVFETKKVLAFSSRTYDGGTISGIDRQCTCSGMTLVKYKSYVDDKEYKYIYSPGITTLYDNSNYSKQGEYFLDTHASYGVCLVICSDCCENQGNPDGTLIGIGTS